MQTRESSVRVAGYYVPDNCYVIAEFHYTDPTRTRPDPRGPARTLSETRTDPTEFLGDPGRKKVRAGPCASGRVRVVEFSCNEGEWTAVTNDTANFVESRAFRRPCGSAATAL